MESLSPGTRINRVSVLRQFCLYLSHFAPRTCIIHRNVLPRRTRPAPYIYTRNEVCRIMVASKRLGGIRGHAVATVVGLLYTTGLRIGEALKLTVCQPATSVWPPFTRFFDTWPAVIHVIWRSAKPSSEFNSSAGPTAFQSIWNVPKSKACSLKSIAELCWASGTMHCFGFCTIPA
jgi:hypothetical protein